MKNWRTTLLGSLAGIAVLALPYVNGKDDIELKDIIIAFALGTIGWLAKDQHNKNE